MIAFGASISGAEAYARYAEPGVRRVMEPDSEVYAFAAVEPIGRTYNLILDAAARRADLEALVLVHPHAEMVEPDLCQKVRVLLRDPDVGIVGCAGATNVRSIAWWEGNVVSAALTQRYVEHGGGELAAFSWTERAPAPGEVECVDGQLIVLSPWVVRNLRLDESLLYTHGFDLDLCLQARAAGRKVIVADLRAVYHRSVELVGDLDIFAEAHIRVAEKWDVVLQGPVASDDDWKLRARRAEADREAARAIAFSKSLALDARVLELERALGETTGSLSWRLTAPLRALNHARRERSSRRAAAGA